MTTPARARDGAPGSCPPATRTIRVGALARVEGEGGLEVLVDRGRVTDVRLSIFEPPRFFEGFLRGRDAAELPDLTARVCGICPVAYQLSACAAVEDAFGTVVPDAVRRLRRLLYCGEWISSHALHVYALHVPDYLGYEGLLDLATDHPDLVERGLGLKQLGDELMAAVGGRAVHPVAVRVGGFTRWPDPARLRALQPAMERALAGAVDTVRLVAGLPVPDLDAGHRFVALLPAQGYPMEGGDVVSPFGEVCDLAAYDAHLVERAVEHSTALHARWDGVTPYAVGPAARFAVAGHRLDGRAGELARSVGPDVATNPFRWVVVRAIETVYALEEALRLIDAWAPAWSDAAGPPHADVVPRAGVGRGATEAPRGILLHRYAFDDEGTVLSANLVPPTSQNLVGMESDLRLVAEAGLDLPAEELTHRCEQAVRNHDPCISCAAHFLTVQLTPTPTPTRTRTRPPP